MKKYRVCLVRHEWVDVVAEDEGEALDAAIDECTGFGDLTDSLVEEIDQEDDAED